MGIVLYLSIIRCLFHVSRFIREIYLILLLSFNHLPNQLLIHIKSHMLIKNFALKPIVRFGIVFPHKQTMIELTAVWQRYSENIFNE
jgi:hypothetical protein